MFTGLMNRLLILLICGALGIGIGWGVAYMQSAPIREGQATAKQLLGDKASLCANSAQFNKSVTSRVNFDGKIAVIHAQDGALYQTYQDALKASRQPKQASEVAGVLCLVDVESVFDTDYYGASKKYSCVRYAHDLHAFLLEANTGKVLAFHVVEGQEPGACPESTDSNLTRYGEAPSPQEIAEWIN